MISLISVRFRWSERRAGGDGGDRCCHVIISEVGPPQLDRYVTQLEGEIEEIMSETVTRCVEEDGQMTQQTIIETETFVIRGVVDPRTGQEVSVYSRVQV